MATGQNTFDGVSIAGQHGRKCTVYLQLGDLETTKGVLGRVKLKNADLPICEVTQEIIRVQITLTVDGKNVGYVWEKIHNGRISKAEVKVEEKQLAVILTKADSKNWDTMFLKELLEV